MNRLPGCQSITLLKMGLSTGANGDDVNASSTIRAVLDEINAIGAWDYRIASFDGLDLTIVSGCTLDYAGSWLAEIVFSDVVYIDCPVNFSHAEFERATTAEETEIRKLVAVANADQIIAIEAETMGCALSPQRFFIVAGRVTLRKRSEGTLTEVR